MSALLDAPLSSLDEVGVGSPSWKQQQQANRRRSSVFPLPMPKREFPTSDDLLSVWRALDDVETGTGMRGYITLAEFNAFMRRGMPECDERQGERWRLRNAERKKEIGRAVRAERSGRGAEAASAGFGDASAESLEAWQRAMASVTKATPQHVARLSSMLDSHLEPKGYAGGWYTLYKAYDPRGHGKIDFGAFSALVRELLGASIDLLRAPGDEAKRPNKKNNELDKLKDQVLQNSVLSKFGTKSARAAEPPPPPSVASSSAYYQRRTHEQIVHEQAVLRSVWAALDTELTGHLTVSEFASFMKIGGQQRKERHEEKARQQQLQQTVLRKQ